MSKKRQAGIPVDPTIYEAMDQYAVLYGLALPDLVARMWGLWSTIEKTRDGLMPAFPPLQESLDAFMAAMEAQAIDLDEEYEATEKRNQAIATYQEAHPFQPDGDDSPTECPSCHRQTTKAGLVFLPGDVVKCDACYSLPRMLQDYEQRYGSE